MKANEFKKLIKEAVREVLKEELFEIMQQPKLQDNVPPPPPVKKPTYKPTGNAMLDALNETRAGMNSTDYQNITGGTLRSTLAQSFSRDSLVPRQSFSPVSDDPRAVEQAVASAPKIGLDLTQLGFVSKAAAIVNEADRKQKEKYGV